MSQTLLDLNADLRRLRDEGYFVQIVGGGLLLLREVPYVNEQKQVRTGTLVCPLDLAGDKTLKPSTHVMHWDGDFPCEFDGTRQKGIEHKNNPSELGHGVTARYAFSSKPPSGYQDFYQKMTTYAALIAGPAAVLEPGRNPRVFPAYDDKDPNMVFNYVDTASGRAGIGGLSEKLEGDVISVIGTGGTGSYILDLVAKTPVREIRLFDADEFLQHNAFRAPGAPSLEELREAPQKVEYLKGIYSRMHRGIVAHPVKLDHSNLNLLDGTTFAFLSMDAGEDKILIVKKLEALGIPFIDVGMGLHLVNGSLGGILSVTTSTPEMREHVHSGRVSFSGGGEGDPYASNIQVADLNALNAVLAVIKWKKLRGFYRDLERENHCSYTTDGNMLNNGDRAGC